MPLALDTLEVVSLAFCAVALAAMVLFAVLDRGGDDVDDDDDLPDGWGDNGGGA